jgi:hypothetical protein
MEERREEREERRGGGIGRDRTSNLMEEEGKQGFGKEQQEGSVSDNPKGWGETERRATHTFQGTFIHGGFFFVQRLPDLGQLVLPLLRQLGQIMFLCPKHRSLLPPCPHCLLSLSCRFPCRGRGEDVIHHQLRKVN